MAALRVQYLRRVLLQPRSGACSRFLCTEVTDATGSPESSPDEGMKFKVKVVGKELALMRREYEKQMSELRKKFAADEERKRKEKRQVELITRERIMVEKEKRLVLKKEKSEIRALEVVEESKSLRARLEEERKSKAARRLLRDKKFLRRVGKEKESVRQQSCMWIEEKDLERRILDALVDPFYLSGSYALPDRDGPISVGDDTDEDDE